MLAKDFLPVGIFIIVGILFVAITLVASFLFRPYKPQGEKLNTYECGEVPFGPAWLQFRVGYYIYALIFLVFDVEAAFVFPWAAGLMNFSRTRTLALLGLVDMLIFVGVLLIGLIYAWKKGVLQWR